MHNEDELDVPRDLLAFIGASPTPYHAVSEAARRLDAAAFRLLDEREPWQLERGDAAYLVRAGGTLIAIRAGLASPAIAGFLLIAAHTDSPGFRVKPCPNVTLPGYRQLAVEPYGSPIWSTWLDRDLSLAGRVTLARGQTRLIDGRVPLCRIPSLAVHLQRNVNQDGHTLNAQQHLAPMLWLDTGGDHQPQLAHLLCDLLKSAGEASSSPADILEFDLCLYDVQPGVVGGAGSDFLFASRLDNLTSCHAALQALLATEPRDTTQVVVLYDHEEVGSRSASGAQSRLLLSVLERLTWALGDTGRDAPAQALARSLLVSVDMAHATHPNYVEKHDPQHPVLMGRGPAIKNNANQSYASDGPASAVFALACARAGFQPQRYVSRNDVPCGSTVGPISAARTGIRTVDVGNPMLSMHSCREVAGVADTARLGSALREVFAHGTAPPPSV